MTQTNFLQSSNTSLDEDNNPKKNSVRPSMLGFFLAVLAALLQALSGICLKAALGAEKTQMLIFRCIMQYLYLAPVIQYKKIDVFGPDRKSVCFMIIRGVTGSFAGLFVTMSLDSLSLGTTLSIFYIYPALVGLFACICLKENCSLVRILLTAITFVGLLFVTEPSFIFGEDNLDDQVTSGARLLGIIFAILAAVMAAISSVVIRKLGARIHFSQSLIYYAVEGLIIVLLQLHLSGKSFIPCRQHMLMLVLSAIQANLGQILLTVAIQRERAGPIASINTSQVVFGFLFEYIILGVEPTAYGCIGASLILLCAVAQSLESTVKSRIRNREKNAG
ncbi:unnamed protein product [Clavelina lepadiformis]|uniref:EamA domain-containing protein n=1 Tax=Clavelina lepadiformis TaxID=159417 RepID=A0ABP0FEI5_CLALP